MPSAEPPGFAELRAGDARVVIIPALGGKITALELAGRQWLWRAKELETGAFDATTPAASLGGLDECFPTAAACSVSIGAAPVMLPEGGELLGQRPDTRVLTPGGVMEAVSTWRGERHPYVFTRAVRLTADGTVEMRYEAHNEGREPLPFLWSMRPLFPLSGDTRIHVPHRSRVRVAAQQRIDLGLNGEHQWPHARLEKKIADFSRPESVARRYAAKLFVDPVGGMIAIEEPPLRLELIVDPQEVPELGIWINRRTVPLPGQRKAHNLVALQPGIGAPDSLADAMGSWNGASMLAPAERRTWTVRWRARKVEDIRPEP